jgi:hypothetical protein
MADKRLLDDDYDDFQQPPPKRIPTKQLPDLYVVNTIRQPNILKVSVDGLRTVWRKCQPNLVRTNDANPCLLWTGSTNNDGYAVRTVESLNIQIHHIPLRLNGLPVPNGDDLNAVDHLCGRRNCVEVSHLTTTSDAYNDMRKNCLCSIECSGCHERYSVCQHPGRLCVKRDPALPNDDELGRLIQESHAYFERVRVLSFEEHLQLLRNETTTADSDPTGSHLAVRNITRSNARTYINRYAQSNDECWIWPHRKINGYGSVSIKRKDVLVHHLSIYAFGLTLPLRRGVQDASHLCNKPDCFNPLHIQIETKTDNMRRKNCIKTSKCPKCNNINYCCWHNRPCK